VTPTLAAKLDPERIETFERYRREYFHDAFRSGQGTEMLLDVLRRYARPGDWLDLGSGPCTLFWGLAFAHVPASITSCDLHPEALAVLDRFARGDEVPPCYAEVLAMLSQPESHLRKLRAVPRHLEAFDALGPWPRRLAARRYDFVSVMGLYGLAAGPAEYVQAFGELADHLRPGARVVGANWLRTPEFARAEGHDNGYVSPELVGEAVAGAGLRLQELSSANITGDPAFRRVIAWVLRA
jgi:SAM-dependent methyltransferase